MESPEPANPKATVWLKPEQVNAMRNVTVATSAGYLAERNDAIIAMLYDALLSRKQDDSSGTPLRYAPLSFYR